MSLASPGLWLVSYLWDWDFCTVASVLGGRHSHEAHLCNEQVSALAEQELKGHPSCGTDVLRLPRPLQPLRRGSCSTLVIPLLRDKI